MLDDGLSGRHRVPESGEPNDPATAADPAHDGRARTPDPQSHPDEANPARPDAAPRPDAAASPPPPGETADPAASAAADGPTSEHRSRSAGRRRRRTKNKTKKTKTRRKAPWWELPALVLLAILIAIGVKTFVVQPFYIPSQSMEKTLHGCPGCHGDRILVNKLIYDLRDPHPGDIVVFHAPNGWDDEPVSRPPSNPLLRAVRGFGQLIGFVPPDGQILVKRVIATGGQTVKGDSTGHVQISTHGPKGPYRTLSEPYVFIDKGQGHSMRAFGPVTVPKGRLWVMGDHRNDSADSRYHCGPGGTDSGDDANCELFAKEATVPVDDVIGKAFVIAWPPSRWRTLGTPATFESAAAAGPALPAAASMATVLPVFLVRRRRRRRSRS
jgi:signal peptidase I